MTDFNFTDVRVFVYIYIFFLFKIVDRVNKTKDLKEKIQ